MLPPYIIEQIRRREEEHLRRQHEQQPQLEIPMPSNVPASSPKPPDDDADRGVVIVDL